MKRPKQLTHKQKKEKFKTLANYLQAKRKKAARKLNQEFNQQKDGYIQEMAK